MTIYKNSNKTDTSLSSRALIFHSLSFGRNLKDIKETKEFLSKKLLKVVLFFLLNDTLDDDT